MEFVNQFTQAQSRPIRVETLLKFTDISPRVQAHLAKVYTLLAACLAVSAVGVWASASTGGTGLLAILGFVGLMTWLNAIPPSPENLRKRELILGGVAFCQGATMAPLVNQLLWVAPRVIGTAFAGTAAVFACFSVAALCARRRSWLFLGGALSSVLSTFMLMRFATLFFGGGRALMEAELYLGLLVFVGYVLFDTQLIVEKAEAGQTDEVQGALSLFIDFAAIFVRLAIILARNAQQRQQRGKEDKRRASGRARAPAGGFRS